RGGGPRALASSLSAVTKTVFGKRGFADGAIVKDWVTIAGEHLARHSLPEKISTPRDKAAGGVLYLTIDSGGMATELQHLEPLLIERINGYFGFKAVDRLKITQGPLPKEDHKPAPPVRPLQEPEESDLAESLLEVDDPELKEALEALGRAVIGRRSG
ncbi:MAG: hypothetical protein CFH04_02027, partial [Alphaproteobacteria bacterium MarineAlpha3_Bin3]